MKIGSRELGPGLRPYVIAELGVNHDGSVDRALELCEAASEAGASAIKLQFFRAELLMSAASKLAAYQAGAGERDPVEMLKRLELSIDQMAPVVFRAHQRGMHAIVTVFSPELVSESERLSWDAYKTASPDIIHRPLLETLAATGRAMIVSTGAASIEEVARAGQWLRGCANTAFLHCVSAYPAPDACAAVAALRDVANATDRLVGYSDHTTRVETAYVAVGAGACILEKHLTLDRTAKGPDHSASLEPAEFAAYVRAADLAGELVGDGRKQVLAIERDVRTLSRQSVVSTRSIPRGRMLEESDVTVKRPGTGLEPHMLKGVVGRVAARDITRDMPIGEDDLA